MTGRAKQLDGRRDTDWMEGANCAGIHVNTFFADKGGAGAILARVARRICADCPVRSDCLAYALPRAELMGIWGGLTADERQDLRNQGAAS